MTELLFNIFGDDSSKVTNTPSLFNDENIGIARNVGKAALDGPVKPQEATKKSFLSNAGKPLQSTPVHPKTRLAIVAPTPIYSDVEAQQDWLQELEFTRPPYRLDNCQMDLFDDSFEIGVETSHLLGDSFEKGVDGSHLSPPPKIKDASMEFQHSYEDAFFTDNIVLDMDLAYEDDLPKIY